MKRSEGLRTDTGTTVQAPRNRRILVIDDQESIHKDMQLILAGENQGDELRDIETILGIHVVEGDQPTFEVDSAYQGEEGLGMVERAAQAGRPYALAFVDMRMPPGWDGLQTISRLWQADPELLVVICSAYSDHSWNDILGELGQTDRFLILKKPFSNIEVSQIALALTEKWHLARKARMKLKEVQRMVDARTSELAKANQKLKDQIRERIRTEKALAAAKELAEQATRAKSDFLASMSHEIRTPMNGVIGMTDLLLDTPLSEEQKQFAETIQRSADALLTIINDILDFSKIEARKLGVEQIDFDLSTLMEDVSDLLAMKAEQKGLSFFCFLNPEVENRVSGDPGRLRQVLINLANNAIKFTRTGEISIRGEIDEEDADKVKVRFSVRDTGIGISESDRAKLFQSFSQVDASMTRKFGGTGLGLAISKELVELMGGGIGVESKEGEGSTFWFSALLKKQPPGMVLASEMPGLAGRRILLVDGHPTNREGLRAHLTAWGCVVEEAESGKEALRLLRQSAAAGKLIDVAIIDMNMREMDGVEIGRGIRQEASLRNTQLILLTPAGQRQKADRLHEIGFDAYLTKPVKQSQLQAALASVLGIQTHGSGAASPVERQARSKVSERISRILLAEDEPANQEVAVTMLQKLGYSVDCVTNGREAVNAVMAQNYDLVLMDCQMPEMDGFEATRILRSMRAGGESPPIVALTANAMKGDREKCLETGMNDYLTKPVKLLALDEMLKRWLRRPG